MRLICNLESFFHHFAHFFLCPFMSQFWQLPPIFFKTARIGMGINKAAPSKIKKGVTPQIPIWKYGSWASKSKQRVDPLGGPFGSPVILDLCFHFFDLRPPFTNHPEISRDHFETLKVPVFRFWSLN